jgi:hypothetical protein
MLGERKLLSIASCLAVILAPLLVALEVKAQC